MNTYQHKWIEELNSVHLSGWEIKPLHNDIYIDMPGVTDLKLIRDNLPETLGLISLDIHEPKARLKFIFHNGREQFEYILNPDTADLIETKG